MKIKVDDDTELAKAAAPADEYIAELQTVLKVSPPPWLAKVMGEKPEQRVRFNQEAAS